MSDRVMYDAVCSECGAQTQVPFQPRGDKPVACRDCFRAAKNGGSAPRPVQQAQAAAPETTDLAVQSSPLAVRVVGQTEQLALAPNRSVEIIWKELTVQEAMTVKIGDQRIILSSVWDFIAQERGISFGTPLIVENTDERVVVEVEATYLNRLGRLVHDAETYEIDCKWIYEMKRLGWAPPDQVEVLDENGRLIWEKNEKGKSYPKRRKLSGREYDEILAGYQANGYLLDEPVYDENDRPIGFKRRLPPAVEKELWDNQLSLKRTKLARAITACHRRITQRAIGTKTLDAKTLKLQFPAVMEHFTDAQIQEAVDDIYGEEILEPQDAPRTVESTATEAEFTASPGPAPAPAPQPDTPPPTPAPSAAPEVQPAAAQPDEKAVRNDLYRAIFGIARKCGDKNEAAVRVRLAEWGCCTNDAEGRPSLRASSLAQVRDAAARYEHLLEELELANQAAF